MKRLKCGSLIVTLLIVFFVSALSAHASLQNLGVDSLGNQLIYDTDLDITWYDFTKVENTWQNSWQTSMDWADALSVTFGSNVYDDWRLPTALNQDNSGPCEDWNCTGSELGHLYYTELENSAGGPLNNTSPFSQLQSAHYWSSTTESTNPLNAHYFEFNSGRQFRANKDIRTNMSAMAVRDGLAVAPEPISSILFITGGAVLAGRRYLKRKRK